LRIPYLTPTVRLYIAPRDYIKYIESLASIHREELIFIESAQTYPVATLAGIEIHFMHYKDQEEAKSKYRKRFERIHGKRILIKIDFGKAGYTINDMQKWNKLRIPNSVAIYPATLKCPEEGIFNGVAIQDWQPDGAKMFDVSRRYFDIFKWVRLGVIRYGLFYRCLNVLLLDPTAPKRIVHRLLHLTA
jgi:uncharacterized protein (DUF1919 family)